MPTPSMLSFTSPPRYYQQQRLARGRTSDGSWANLVLVAQLVEHKAENLGVIGSSPI